MRGDILIPIASFSIILLFLFGLKELVFVKSPCILFPAGRSNKVQKEYICFRLLNIYRKSPKKRFLLLFSIFIVLCFAFYLFFENFIFSLFVGLCGIILVVDIFRGMEDRRRDLLHSQLIEFINVMIIMLKAGRTIRNIIRGSVKWLKAPLKGCVENLAKELELNFTLEDALERFSKSCGTTEAKLLVSALKINNQIGGDLIFVLNSIVDTLRSSFKIRSQIKTLTLQSRFSGNIISLFPLIVLSGLFVFMNSAVKVFFSSSAGNILLVVGGIFELLGILVMKSLLKVDS